MNINPKRPKGPPLNAMRAFEAAARHVSFIMAAHELNVTPGAISQHIKTLENWAGTPLFRRNVQGVELTNEGQNLLTSFTKAFDSMAEATRVLHNLKPNIDFHIAALPSIAQLWLPKRLARIRSVFPNIHFSVTALETPPNLTRELFDLSIFFCTPDASPNHYKICDDLIQPVCTPLLLKQIQNSDFTKLPVLHDLTWKNDWSLWSKSANFSIPKNQTGSQFSLYSLAVEEAKAGAGLLMGHLCLIQDLLNEGILVKAHPHFLNTNHILTVELPEKPLQRIQTAQIAQFIINASAHS